MGISAVLVTRGDVDLQEIIECLPFDDIVIWDNSKRTDHKVFGRYLAITEAKHDVIYTQDDDCLVDASEVVKHYEPGKVACNMPLGRRDEYSDGLALMGWGAVFDRSLVSVLQKYLSVFPLDEFFCYTADRIFTKLSQVKMIDVPFQHLPHAYGDNRMWRRPDDEHWKELAEVRRRLAAII